MPIADGAGSSGRELVPLDSTPLASFKKVQQEFLKDSKEAASVSESLDEKTAKLAALMAGSTDDGPPSSKRARRSGSADRKSIGSRSSTSSASKRVAAKAAPASASKAPRRAA